jgi:DNA-binding response OmpR family regulator
VRYEAEVAQVGAGQLAEIFACHVAVLVDADDARAIAVVPGSSSLSPSDLAAASYTLQSGERSGRGERRSAQADWQFHPISSGDEVLAALGLARDDGTAPIGEERTLLFESLLNQLASALARARLEGDARDAAALRARDKLRSALLTSIGDEIKPRLKVLQAGVRALRRDGAADRRLIAELDGEVTRIDRHIDNLVDVNPGSEGDTIPLGEVTIDLHSRSVTRSGEAVHLTPKEFAVLAELTRHAGRVLTHAQLLRAVWGPAQQEHVDYLRVAISALRRKLESDPSAPLLIVNEPGISAGARLGRANRSRRREFPTSTRQATSSAAL